MVKEKRRHLAEKKTLFYKDNVRVNCCVVAMKNFHGLEYELRPHPPYSSDLEHSDYLLFLNMEMALETNCSNDEGVAKTNAYFEGFKQSYF